MRLTVNAETYVGFVFLTLISVTCPVEAKTVTVHVQSGRTFIGEVDPKSDNVTLWMRFESVGRIKVLRPIKWTRVTRIESERREVDAEQVRSDLAEWATQSTLVPNWNSSSSLGTSADQPQTMSGRARRALGMQARPVSIVAAARLAQWDSDVPIDGIEVVVTPLDDQGNPIDVSGTVSLEFVVPKAVDREQAPRQHGVRFTTVARSSHLVSSSDYGGDGVVLRLRFRGGSQFDRSYYSHGIVHVRMTIPGHGVFRTSVEDMPTRSFSRIRDLSERVDGRRYLPQENVRTPR